MIALSPYFGLRSFSIFLLANVSTHQHPEPKVNGGWVGCRVRRCLCHGGLMVLVSGLAPLASNRRSAPSCPFRRASQSGVIPNFKVALTSAP